MKNICVVVCLLGFICSAPGNIEKVTLPKDFNNTVARFDEPVLSYSLLDNSSMTAEGAFAGMVGSRFVLAGGLDSSLELKDNVSCFDVQTDLWLQYKLQYKVANGAYVVSGDSLVCFGGVTETGISDKIFSLTFEDGQITQKMLGTLPEALAYCTAAVFDDHVYLIGGVRADGGSNTTVFKADITNGIDLLEFAPMPEDQIKLSCISGDAIVADGAIYVFGGLSNIADARKLPDVNRIEINERGSVTLKILPDCPVELGRVAAVDVGQSHIFVEPQGSDSQPLYYHTITDSWSYEAKNADAPQADYAVLSGEQYYLAGSGGIYEASLVQPGKMMKGFDYFIVIVYLAVLVGVGVYFAKREDSVDQYFVGGRKIPTWAIAFSIFATGTSGLSFMAIPAKSYMTNLLFFGAIMVSSIFMVLLAFLFPYLRRLEITTIYEYLEARFDCFVRVFGAIICVIYQVGVRMSVAMYIPALALSVVTGIDVKLSIVVMGVLATVYTYLGGIEAVIWSDVIQSVVMIFGAFIAIFLLIGGIDGGLAGYIDIGRAYGKFRTFDMGWDYSHLVLWVAIVSGVELIPRTFSDQAYMQRAFCAKNPKESRNSQLISVAICMPMAIIFWGLGTLLFSYFKSNPASLAPSIPNDAIFPLFIVRKIPVGLCGLVIAGLFSAAMSTLDSSMNTVSAVVVTDIYKRFWPASSEHKKLSIAKMVTLVTGVGGTLVALIFACSDIKSIYDVFESLARLSLSALAALMTLGLFTKRVGRPGAYVAIVVAIVMAKYIQTTPVHFFLYSFIVVAVASLAGCLVSVVFPEKRDLKGLTFWDK